MNTTTTPPSLEMTPLPHVPVKDPIIERVYDYTKWHIALHGAVLGVLAGGLALGRAFPLPLLVSVLFLVVAAIAAGTLASSLSRRENWEGFLQTKTFPLVPDSKNVGLTMQCWMHIQHAGIWAAILWGVGFAVYVSFHPPALPRENSLLSLQSTASAAFAPKP